MHTADSEHTADALLQYASDYCQPEWLRTDKGSPIAFGLMSKLIEIMGGWHATSPIYAPFSNGGAERVMRDILTTLRALLSEKQLHLNSWAGLLHIVQHKINHTPSRILGGRTPWYVATGQPSRTALTSLIAKLVPAGQTRSSATLQQLEAHMVAVLDQQVPLLKDELDRMHVSVATVHEAAREANRAAQTARRKAAMPSFEIGDLVLHAVKGGRRTNKLAFSWAGPKQVVRQINTHLYVVEDISGDASTQVEAHISHLRFYAERSRAKYLDLTKLLAQYKHDTRTFTPDKILSHNVIGTQVSLTVKWRGLATQDTSLEPYRQFNKDVPHLVQAYIKTLSPKSQSDLRRAIQHDRI
jgi:hypothetical protein